MTVSRPMLWLSATFVAGMYAFAFLGATAAYTVIFCAIIAATIKAIRKRKLYDNLILLLCVISLISGMVRFAIKDDIAAKKLDPYLGQTVTLAGEIIEEPNAGENYIHIRLKTDTVTTETGKCEPISEIVSLTCFTEDSSKKSFPVIHRGDVVSVDATLSLPKAAMNGGGFDYAAYLKTKNIYFQATGKPETLVITGHRQHVVSDAVYKIRKYCMVLCDNTFPAQISGIVKAYVLGDDSGVDGITAETFSVSGLSHVLAVSGMHIAVFLSVITVLLRKIRIPKRGQLILSLILVLVFTVFTGMSISALRAGFVCFMAILAQLLYRRSDPMTALFEAAAVLCIWNPMVILSASFMLSFGATIGILLFGKNMTETLSFVYKPLKKKPIIYKLLKSICDIVAIGIAAQIFTIPILIYLFQAFSATSVIATVFVTPLLAPLLAGGLLFCMVASVSTTLALPVAGFVYFLAKCMLLIADLFASLPLARITYGTFTPFFILCYAVFVVLIYAALDRKKILYCISLFSFMAFAIIFLCHSILVYPIAEVTFINVGQGDCAFVQLPGNCDILIDAGGKEDDYSIAEDTVYPYLVQKGAYDIEYAIASHGHADHINGLIGLMDLTRIKHLIVPEGFGATAEAKVLLEKAKEKNIPVIHLSSGDKMTFGDCLSVTAIMPDSKILSFASKDENERSLVLKLEYGETSFLFTGDISGHVAEYAASTYYDSLHADVLKAAHHGAKNANSEQFLDAVSPDYVYIPVGRNSYGHPDGDFLTRLSEKGIVYYRADKQRDVTFYIDKTRIRGIQYESSNSRGD